MLLMGLALIHLGLRFANMSKANKLTPNRPIIVGTGTLEISVNLSIDLVIK